MARLKRTKILRIRLTFAELALLKRKAKEFGKTTSRFVRESSLGKEIKPKYLSDEEKQAYKTMAGLANNINQIASKFNQGDRIYFELHESIQELRLLTSKILQHDREN